MGTSPSHPARSACAWSLSSSLFPLQKPRRAAPTPSPARAPMCVSLRAGSVTVTRTVLMAPMRASQPAAVSGRGLKEWGGQQGPQSSTLRKGTLRSRRGSASAAVTEAVSGRSLSVTRVLDPCPCSAHSTLGPQEGPGGAGSSWPAGAAGSRPPLSAVYNNTCDDREFMCQNRQCIPKHFVCDHDRDCADGSDESPECGEPGHVALGNRPCPRHEGLRPGHRPHRLCLLPQSTRPAAPTSSAAPTGAV